MENSMQNANEKMVPIDTSGDPVEVELNEDKKEEDVEIQQEEQETNNLVEETVKQEEPKELSLEKPEPEVPADPYETGDLDNYSKGVKKRINNLVGRMREMEDFMKLPKKKMKILKRNIVVWVEVMYQNLKVELHLQ